MARSPDRVRDVFFLGAGFGKAANLPNTAELLLQAHSLSGSSTHWGVARKIGERLDAAYDYFYPDHADLFRPDVPDFFNVLSTYAEIAAEGLPQGFDDRALLTDLKFVIARLLTQNTKRLEQALAKPHELLDRMVKRGNVVVTTNWDLLVEKAAELANVPVRLSGPPSDSSLVLLKLHGSIDWTLKAQTKKPVSQTTYASLQDLMYSRRDRRHSLTPEVIVRIRGALDKWTAAYQAIKGATDEPYMLTMARGKADLIQPILPIWADAYRAISSAKRLHIIGYSMPEDDVEIRTLLRAGCKRGAGDPAVIVKNPAPDVHVRVRSQVHGVIEPDYRPIPPIEA